MKKSIFGLVLAIFCFCLMLTGCGKTPAEYEISVLINGAVFGTVEDVSGTYLEGASVTINAKPYDGQTFFCWLHDGKIVSADLEYTFTVNEENSGSYLALFECADLEYISLDSFDFTNSIPEYNGDTEQTLSEITLSFGYSQNELYTVYTCTEDNLPEEEASTVSFDTIYAETQFPYAFDKTKDIYIKVFVKYITLLADVELEYISETTFILPSTNVGETVQNVENQVLNITKNTANENLVLEDTNQETGNYKQNSISINFKNLSDFTFEQPKSEE